VQYTGYWLIVASRDHVLAGKKATITQASHGKKGPLDKMQTGDWIVYYSPKKIYGDTKPYQKFIAIARVTGEKAFQISLSDTFKPYRLHAEYVEDLHETDIRPLITDLEFIKNKSYWGMAFLSGFLSIPKEDFILICSTMKNKGSTES